MKNLYYIAIAALLAASAGCSKVEVADAPDKAVTFTVASYSPQTRAESIITVDGIRSFSSRGYLHGVGVDAPQDFFPIAGEIIKWNADAKEWAPSSHDYYWPKSSKSYVNFISWVGGNPTITYTKESETYKATFAWSGAVATTDNLMWADMAWRYHANDKTPVYGENGVTEGVPTLFHHALAQVRFQGKVTKTSATDGGKTVNWTVNITDFSLSNVAKSGTFSITNDDPGSTTTQEWSGTIWKDVTVVNTDKTIASTASVSAPILIDKTTADEDGNVVMAWSNVIPQSAGTVSLTITYTVKTEYVGSKTVEEEVTTTAVLSDFKIGSGDSATSIDNWERNKRYTYTLIIEPDTGVIKIIPVEADWTEGATKEITVE